MSIDDRPTLDEFIAALTALRRDDAAGQLPVTAHGIEGWEDVGHGIDVLGVRRVTWNWGGGFTSINLRLRLSRR